ncbi:centromere protein K-like [Eudromia elegans]
MVEFISITDFSPGPPQPSPSDNVGRILSTEKIRLILPPQWFISLEEQFLCRENDLEMVLSTLQSKNKKLREDLKREQQWHDEQLQIVDVLSGIEEEMKNQVVQFSEKRAFQELKNKMLKLRTYEEELLNALGEFLEEHFPLPEEDGSAKKKRKR